MNFPRPFLLACCLLPNCLLFAQNTAVAADPPAIITVGTGFDFSRGDYGLATDTDVFSVPLTLGYERGPWLLEARVPWLRIEGPAAVIAGGGSPTRPTAAAESGLGDMTLAGTYRYGVVAAGVNLATTLRVKLPTGSDSRGLGTGKTDYTGQVDFYRNFGRVTPFFSVGYTDFGSSALYPLEDGPYASGGAHFRTGENTVITTAYSWRDRLVAGGEAGRDVLFAVNHDFSARWRGMAYALKGFSDGSPDHGGGVSLTWRY